MGFAMQCNTAVPMPTFQQSLKASNPFDVNSEPPSVQTSTFPPMASSQGALPNVWPPSGLVCMSSLGAPSSAWMPLQTSSYSSGLPLQAPPYVSQMPPSAYMGQQIPSSMPPSRVRFIFSKSIAGWKVFAAILVGFKLSDAS